MAWQNVFKLEPHCVNSGHLIEPFQTATSSHTKTLNRRKSVPALTQLKPFRNSGQGACPPDSSALVLTFQCLSYGFGDRAVGGVGLGLRARAELQIGVEASSAGPMWWHAVLQDHHVGCRCFNGCEDPE